MTLDEALDSLLGSRRSGDLTADLIGAAREAMRRREQNSALGGEVIAALLERGHSYRDIERETGIPRATAQRWGRPPHRV